MTEHTGFHEYKDGERFNPECLTCLADKRDKVTKQEEIREGIKRLALEEVCPYSMKPATPYEINAVRKHEAFELKVVDYLHSQGLVIRVDTHLPFISRNYKLSQHGVYVVVDNEALNEQGYVAVEPLILEG